jgi:hypothetical protein
MTVTQSTVAYWIERRDPSGNEIQHVATADDLTVALAIYKAAGERWPNNSLTLRQGSRVIADSRRTK